MIPKSKKISPLPATSFRQPRKACAIAEADGIPMLVVVVLSEAVVGIETSGVVNPGV